ncbi:MAG: 50S ribosomal protein L37ae [Candidatus Hydrothermarchaeales archaeon]
MAKKTKKAGPAGKFGSRYGMRLRKRYAEIDRKMRKLHKCPSCQKIGVKRVASGIWQCRKCGAKFTGGAYLPKTSVAATADRVLKRVTGES